MEGDARDFISGIIFVDTTQNSAKTTLMPIIETVRLIMADISSNHNKHWTGFLHDDGSITSENGRVGVTTVSNTCRGSGKHDFDKLVASKRKKGYTDLRTVATSGVQVVTPGKQDLHQLALEQIQTSSPLLTKLIKRLVEANVHQITKATQISFNSSSGLFTTPLGVVTLDGITEARDILADLTGYVQKHDYGADCITKVSKFLSIVPQNIGMKRLEVRTFIPDIQSIQKQNDILDSLEASYQAMQTPAANAAAPKSVAEKVFSVKLGLLEDPRERARIEKKYRDTRKDQHVCSHLRVKEIYLVQIESQQKAYEIGRKVGTEMELWHGTKQANLLSILKSGLKVSPPSTARIAGKMFGNGVYFAIDSTKSLNYSYGYWDGKTEKNCFMFLCPVSLGKYYVPAGSYEHLPKSGFDSTWAKSGKSGVRNDEIIVYNNDRFDLKYLVEFE